MFLKASGRTRRKRCWCVALFHHCVSVFKHFLCVWQHIGHESITGQHFHEKVTATVNLLKWKGVVPNDRVLMTIQPSIEFYAIAIGVFAIGGSLIIIDTSMGLERANHCIATAKPSVWLWMKGSKFKFLKVQYCVLVVTQKVLLGHKISCAFLNVLLSCSVHIHM